MLRVFKRICNDLCNGGSDVDALALVPVDYDLAKICCPVCRACASMRRHGKYQRHYVYLSDGIVIDALITIVRLRCASCGTTHALLPLGAIPYSAYSIRLIAHIVIDALDHVFPSIEALCEHYAITSNTFLRIRRRFAACVRLARGQASGDDGIRTLASLLASHCQQALDDLLSSFFDTTGSSFCQMHGP